MKRGSEIREWFESLTPVDTGEPECENQHCIDGYLHDEKGAILFRDGKALMCDCRKRKSIDKWKTAYRASVAISLSREASDMLSSLKFNLGHAPAANRAFRGHRSEFPTSNSIIVCGPTGSGKTSIAHLLVRGWHDHPTDPRAAVFMSAVRYADCWGRQVRDESASEYIDQVARWTDKRETVLVIDDLGGERAGGTASEKLAEIIDIRCSMHAPTIITTNLNLEKGDMGSRYGIVLESRVLGNPRWIMTCTVRGRNLREIGKDVAA